MNEVFWVRLFCAEFDDPRWLAIEQMPDADAVQIIYIRMLMLAGRCNAKGLLLLHESLPYDLATLAAVLRRSVPVVQFALATLEKFRFIEMVDNVIAITEWDRLQATDELAKLAAKRDKDKLRKREERAEKKNILLPSKDMSADASDFWDFVIYNDLYELAMVKSSLNYFMQPTGNGAARLEARSSWRRHSNMTIANIRSRSTWLPGRRTVFTTSKSV